MGQGFRAFLGKSWAKVSCTPKHLASPTPMQEHIAISELLGLAMGISNDCCYGNSSHRMTFDFDLFSTSSIPLLPSSSTCPTNCHKSIPNDKFPSNCGGAQSWSLNAYGGHGFWNATNQLRVQISALKTPARSPYVSFNRDCVYPPTENRRYLRNVSVSRACVNWP